MSLKILVEIEIKLIHQKNYFPLVRTLSSKADGWPADKASIIKIKHQPIKQDQS